MRTDESGSLLGLLQDQRTPVHAATSALVASAAALLVALPGKAISIDYSRVAWRGQAVSLRRKSAYLLPCLDAFDVRVQVLLLPGSLSLAWQT